MNKNKSRLIWGIIIAVLLIGLFAIPRFNDPNRGLVSVWKNADIDCLSSHQNAALHIHPTLQIFVDGKPESIPQDTGIVKGCMSEIHTHDSSGTLHAESVSSSKQFTLGNFFTVWGRDINRDGYELNATVDGISVSEVENIVLRDGAHIILNYISL